VLKDLFVMKNLKQPNEEEFSLLKRISTQDNRKKVRLRANIIICKLDGLSYRKIVKKLKCCKDTIKTCINEWNLSGLGSILSWKRKISLGKNFKRRNAIERLIQAQPAKLDFPFSNWSLRTIRAFFSDWVNLEMSLSTLWRDLKVLNVKYRIIEDKLIDKPVDYEEKKAVLTFIKRFKGEKTRIVYLDEKGPIHVLRHLGRIWSSKPVIKEKRKPSKGKISFLGAFDNIDYKFSMYFLYDHKAASFCHSLKNLIKRFLKKPYTKLLFVMDNAIIHHSSLVTEFFKKNKRIDVFYLPTYSPELNPIELCFNQYQRELINNRTFLSAVDLMNATYKYVDYFNTQRRNIMIN